MCDRGEGAISRLKTRGKVAVSRSITGLLLTGYLGMDEKLRFPANVLSTSFSTTAGVSIHPGPKILTAAHTSYTLIL